MSFVVRKLARLLVPSAAIATLVAPAIAAPAHAAPYVASACAGAPATQGGWTSSSLGGMPGQVTDTCAAGGGFGGTLLGNTVNPPGGRQSWEIAAPAGTTLAGLDLTRSLAVAGGPQSPPYMYGVFLYRPSGGFYYAAPDFCLGEDGCTRLMARGLGFHWRAAQPTGFAIARVACDAASGQTCASVSQPIAAWFSITRAQATFDDANAPELTAPPSGPLLSPAVQWGTVPFTVSARDVGGGVAQALVEIDGRVRATFPFASPEGTCRQPYVVPVPCPLTATQTFGFDTTQLADGVHTLRILVRDATLANEDASQPYVILTSQRGLPNGVPAAGTRLSARLRAGGAPPRASTTVGYGTRAVLTGQLTTAAGQPVQGAQVLAEVRTDVARSPWRALGAARTSATGAYALRLPAGPSRVLRVTYRTMTRDAQPAAVALAHLQVRAGVRARFPARVTRGRLVVFSGRVLGGEIPAGGKLIEFQARQGAGWVTFAATHTSPSGRFAFRYRFAPGPAAVHQLRVLVPRESGFAWTTAATAPQQVVVRAG
jgi:hypothetical protein